MIYIGSLSLFLVKDQRNLLLFSERVQTELQLVVKDRGTSLIWFSRYLAYVVSINKFCGIFLSFLAKNNLANYFGVLVIPRCPP